MVYALRSLAREAGLRFIARRKAAFTVAVLTMALALGANTIVFSALKTFFFSSIGVPEADRLLAIMPTRDLDGGRGSDHYDEAYPNYDLIRRIQHSFAAITLAYPGITSWDDRGEARPREHGSRHRELLSRDARALRRSDARSPRTSRNRAARASS